jgi:DNA repair exonuclease SbcCD ATPase subunit
MSSGERRQHTRHRVFRIAVKVASPEAFRASYLKDLSRGGLFVRSAKPLPNATRVVVALSVEGHPELALPGEVARVDADGFGVRFDALTPEQRQAVDALIAACRARSPTPFTDPTVLAERLAEATGAIEAYEETLANLREAESEAHQRAEALDLERGLLAGVLDELREKNAALEAERARLATLILETQRRLEVLEREARTAREAATREHDELEKTRASLVEAQREHTLRLELEAELSRLRQSLTAMPDGAGALRAELQELSTQLDDERLKSMALQRALERFVAMGGSIPARKE